MKKLAVFVSLLALGVAAAAGDEPDDQRRVLELLASTEELAVLDSLPAGWRRDAFVERFWSLRDPFPQTARNELRERWEQRAEAAHQRFGTLDDDRSRLLLLHGDPAEVVVPRCGSLLRPIEMWSWPRADLLAVPFVIVVELRGGGKDDRRGQVWDPMEGLVGLAALPSVSDDAEFAQLLLDGCVGGSRVLDLFAKTVRWPLEGPDRRTWPVPDAEWVHAFRDRSTELTADAELLEGLAVDVGFAGRRQSRTVVRFDVSLPTDTLTPTVDADLAAHQAEAYRFLVDGEVLRDGALFDSFRYRFELPVGAVGEKVALPIERALRPAGYEVALRIRELAAGGKQARWQATIAVPVAAAAGATLVTDARTAPAAPAATGSSPAPEVQDPTLRLFAPSPELLRGLVRVSAVVEGPISSVRFELDGRPVLTRNQGPWSVEIDLGHIPSTRRLRAVGLDRSGEVVADDTVLLNGGPHRFAVRLIEPSRGVAATAARVRVVTEVEVPEAERVDRVEVYLNDDRVSTLYQAPWETTVELPGLDELGWIRAVAVLSSGATAEDIQFVNAPDLLDRIEVDFVELYTTVVDRRGRPVEGLEREQFTVREDGRIQAIRRFEQVRDTPLHAGIVLDVSGSMQEELPEAEAAALAFFSDLLRPTDRACVITFSEQPELRVRFTNDIEVLAGGLAGLHAYGNTSLWDTVVYSLFYFNGVRGKRALVLISDGEDSGSRHTFTEALDFARRSGVTIYTVALGRAAQQNLAASALSRLASETGGRFFSVGAARDLRSVYERIDQELRSQYLITYQSDADLTKSGYREVEVEVRGDQKLEARTARGYFP